MASLLVVGFGNGLVGDDGVGPAVLDCLSAIGVPPGVRLVDGGQDALRLPSWWRGETDVWLVDALIRGAEPGCIHRVEHDDLLSIPQHHGTAHQLALPECLRLLEFAWPAMAGVRYRLFGVEPECLDLREGLSPRVRLVVPELAGEILEAAQALVGERAGTQAQKYSGRYAISRENRLMSAATSAS